MAGTASDTQLATRLYVTADLAAGSALPLEADKAHFLGRVLRLTVGRHIGLFNGRDGFWQARIDALGKRDVVVVPETLLTPQPATSSGTRLIIPPIKKARADWLVEKATELGVAAINPIITERTAVRDLNLERWRKITIEAAEQCERLSLPDLTPPESLNQFLAGWPKDTPLHVAVERTDAVSLSSLVPKTPVDTIIVGPEGGFAPSELDQFAKLPFVHPVSLGPGILRAETAALAALAIINARPA